MFNVTLHPFRGISRVTPRTHYVFKPQYIIYFFILLILIQDLSKIKYVIYVIYILVGIAATTATTLPARASVEFATIGAIYLIAATTATTLPARASVEFATIGAIYLIAATTATSRCLLVHPSNARQLLQRWPQLNAQPLLFTRRQGNFPPSLCVLFLQLWLLLWFT